jgi:thioesterase domain-containing protein
MARKYRAQSTVAGPMLVVRATLPDPDMPSVASHSSAWSRFVRGPMSEKEVAGTHTGIVRRPTVMELADAIGGALDAAEPR